MLEITIIGFWCSIYQGTASYHLSFAVPYRDQYTPNDMVGEYADSCYITIEQYKLLLGHKKGDKMLGAVYKNKGHFCVNVLQELPKDGDKK